MRPSIQAAAAATLGLVVGRWLRPAPPPEREPSPAPVAAPETAPRGAADPAGPPEKAPPPAVPVEGSSEAGDRPTPVHVLEAPPDRPPLPPIPPTGQPFTLDQWTDLAEILAARHGLPPPERTGCTPPPCWAAWRTWQDPVPEGGSQDERIFASIAGQVRFIFLASEGEDAGRPLSFETLPLHDGSSVTVVFDVPETEDPDELFARLSFTRAVGEELRAGEASDTGEGGGRAGK